MRFTPRTWALLSVMLFVAAALFWLKGNELEARRRQAKPKTELQTNKSAKLDLSATRSAHFPLAQLNSNGVKTASTQGSGSGTVDRAHPFRLRNTSRDLDELVHEDKAILLANALVDTANGADLKIPAHLKAKGEPGSYIVQATRAPDAKFRQELADAGVQIISYVPNNAYLVKGEKAAADQLASAAGVQAVLPFEPYYKLSPGLLKSAVEQEPLSDGTLLRLTLIPGERTKAIAELRGLKAVVLSEESSPFGPQVVVQPELTSLAKIAQMSSVQGIEPDLVRMPANDLSRIALGIATNGSASNYLNLTGSNIWVNFNDEGIDTNYAGLKGRVFLGYPAMGGTDVDGHGTFVAGMIAGDGSNSPDLGTNSFGSDTNANFRGIAPMAKLFGLPLDSGADVYPKVQDTYLIETAARSNYLTLRRTNTLISNNSWTYGTHDYDSSAARYDAAVRDAIPGATGSQPLLFVFAAGNSGFGNDDGTGGEANTIESPATAKNVITVGALEQARFITNSYVLTNVFTNTLGTLETNMVTNFPFAALTDTSDSVANFSSRGNVGAGFEGNNGRFKPDVVAPGTMIISARSSGWNITNVIDTNTPLGQLYADLHGDLKEYRFDSGSTFAAANISGTLALIQEYYETQAPTPLQGKLSPALMKGLLINGSRSLSRLYDIAAQNFLNHQGWGLPSLPAVFPSFSTNAHKDLDEKHWRLRYVDQSPTNALATGQSRTWNVTLATNASGFPMRVTLVWTDPPGNPNVGVKLVNDLDLIITNLDTKVVWFGNNIPVGNDFTEVSYPDEGDPIIQDAVNNVENIIIGNPFQYGQRFSITVRAKRVNVNSVNDFLARTGNTNDVTQDFALIVSSDIGEDPSLNTEDFDFREEEVFTEFDSPEITDNGGRLGLTVITNGLPLLSERVGANASLVGTNGITNQWNFYVFTNIYIPNSFVNITNGSNVAFVTFDPPNLARPRNLEADIDLYVSTDPGLTNLEPAVLASAFKSTERGGTEMVVFTNATVGAGSIYYVAVKSEDQQAAEFSLIGISSDVPFDQDQNGQRLITAMPFSSFIPDGSASKPAASTLIGIGLHDRRVQRIIATNTVSHENLGDLVGILRHSGTDVILNNHTLNNGNYIGTNTIIYNDYDPTGLERHTDGPGSLNNFAGTKITGPWFMYMIDNSPSHTGRVELLTLLIKPLEKPLIEGVAVTATIDPNQMLFYPIDVPPGVTNLTFRFTDMTAGGTLEAYLRRDELPTTNIYELKTTVTAPGGVFTFPTTNNPPLTPGTYFLALRNPGGVPVTFTMTVFFDYEDNPNNQFNFTSAGPELFDDVSTNATLDISEDKLVGAVQVGVRMGHPRVSDTVLRLVTPQGSSILLQENRGQTNGEGIGSEYYVTNGVVVTTNTTYTIYTDDTNVAQLPIKFTMPPYQDNLAGKLGVILTNGFEGVTNGNYLAGRNVAGWTVLPNKSAVDQVSILSGLNYSHSGTNALSLGTGIIATNITTVPGRSYRLVFAYRGANQDILYNTGVEDTGLLRNSESSDVHYVISNSTDSRYQSGIAYVFDPKPFGNWLQTNKLSGWVAPYPVSTTGIFTPDYFFTYRTYVDLYGYQSTNASVSVKIASDNDVADTYLNGKSLGITTPVNSYQAWSAPIPISGFVPGLNVLEFRVRDFGPPTGFRLEKVNINAQSITNSGVSTQAIANVMISGIRTNTVVGSTNWRTRAIDFVAKNTTTQIRFAAEMGELWLDSVQVEASGNIYVLPEEPLASVQGERAIGQWKLELLDNKTGAEVPLPELLSWKLDLIYADPLVLAEPLQNNRTYPKTLNINQTNWITPGTLFTNQTHYFLVNTCPDTTEATVTLIGSNNVGQVEMLIDRSGIPTGNAETDDYVPLLNTDTPNNTPNGSATFRITTNSPASAPLEPGKPFFIVVRNRSVNTTNSYMLNVRLDRSSCVTRQSTPLIKRQSITSMLSATAPSDENQGELYSVEVPEGSQSVSVNVAADGDVAIVAQKDVMPTRESYSLAQDVFGSGTERLTINSNSSVPLSSGTWYFLLLNQAPRPVIYNIEATGDLPDQGGGVVIDVQRLNDWIQITWYGEAGSNYTIQSSTDLENWTDLDTVAASGGTLTYTTTTGFGKKQFFRIVKN